MARRLVFVGDINDKKNYEGNYNIIIATEVLEHLEDDRSIFNNFKKESKFIFSLPTFNCKGHFRWFETPLDIIMYYINCLSIQQLEVVHDVPYWFVGWAIVK